MPKNGQSLGLIMKRSDIRIILLDGNKSVVGGVETLNADLTVCCQKLGIPCARYSWLGVFKAIVSSQEHTGKKVSVVMDLSATWKRLGIIWMFRLMTFCIGKRNREYFWILREHHYSEYYLKRQSVCRGRLRILLKLFYRSLNRIIFVSQAQYEWAKRTDLVSPHPGKACFIRHATKLALGQKKPEGGIEEKQNLCIYGVFGRLCEQKGILELVKMWVEQVDDKKLQLLVGGYGDEERQITELCESSTNASFVGRVEEPDAFLAQIDYLIVPSRWEPFGLVATEAKAAGVPVIVSDRDGLPEQAEGCGWVYRIDEFETFQSALVESYGTHQSKETYLALSHACQESYKNQRINYSSGFLELLTV